MEDEDERKVSSKENTPSLLPIGHIVIHLQHRNIIISQLTRSLFPGQVQWGPRASNMASGLQDAQSRAVGTRCQNMQHRISSSLMSLVLFSLSSSKIQLIQSKIPQIHLNGSCEDQTISWLSAGVTSDLCDSNNVMKADEMMMWAERWAWRSFQSQTDETLRNTTHPARVHGDQPPPVAMAAAGGPAGHSQRSCEWIIVLLQFLKSDLSEPRAAEQHRLFQTIRWCGFSSSSWCLFQSSIRGQIILLPPKLFVVYVGFLSSLCIFMIMLKVLMFWCCWTVLMMSCDEGKLYWMCLNKRLNSRVQTVHKSSGVVGLHLVQIHEDVTGNKLLRVFFEYLAWGAAGWCLSV